MKTPAELLTQLAETRAKGEARRLDFARLMGRAS